jgi:hypothetical protein
LNTNVVLGHAGTDTLTAGEEEPADLGHFPSRPAVND